MFEADRSRNRVTESKFQDSITLDFSYSAHLVHIENGYNIWIDLMSAIGYDLIRKAKQKHGIINI